VWQIFLWPKMRREAPPSDGVMEMVSLLVLAGGLVALVEGLRGVLVGAGDAGIGSNLSLSPLSLPVDALWTMARMMAAMAASFVFSLAYGALAAKSPKAEMLLIPILDVLQSVPVLGYASFALPLLMPLFPGQTTGIEAAAVFAVFTSQAWNMTLSVYQSLRTVPDDLRDAAQACHLSPWKRFWRLEVPFAMPGLVWNMMMSASGGWFFIVASESVTLGQAHYAVPGLGSYVAAALVARDGVALGWGLAVMVAVILFYDQIAFRPLAAWAEKFRVEDWGGREAAHSWVLDLLRRSVLRRWALHLSHRLVNWPGLGGRSRVRGSVGLWLERRGWPSLALPHPWGEALWYGALALVTFVSSWHMIGYLAARLGWADLWRCAELFGLTFLRVCAAVLLGSLLWLPIGVWVGLRPRWARRVQPLAQILAAFPANLLFPVVVVMILRFHQSSELWAILLLLLGSQWYILFNVVAGAASFPHDLREVADHLRVGGWLWWRRVALPGLFPYYITGALTAAGGAWNASILAELLTWGDQQVSVAGIGAYIARTSASADYPRLILALMVMSRGIALINRLFWKRLYGQAERRNRRG